MRSSVKCTVTVTFTGEQKRKLVATLLIANPERSNRQVAADVGASDHTVAEVRYELESIAQIARFKKKRRKRRSPVPDRAQGTFGRRYHLDATTIAGRGSPVRSRMTVNRVATPGSTPPP
jgi:hypothetical protein